MKIVKMSLDNLRGKLSRTAMKNLMAGSGTGGCGYSGCPSQVKCEFLWTCNGGAVMNCNCHTCWKPYA